MRKAVVVGLFVLAGLLGLAFFIGRGGLTIRITQAEAQARLDARLPFAERGMHHSYELSRMTIRLVGGDRVEIDCDFAIELSGRAASGTIFGTARPVYRDHKLYLEDFELRQLKWNRLELAESDRSIRERIVARLVGGLIERQPIYESKALARKILREIHIEPGVLVAVLDPTTF